MEEKPLKYLFTGSRDWSDEEAVKTVLDDLSMKSKLIHGKARGLDLLLDRLAISLGWPREMVVGYPAQWNVHGRAAGPIRNQEMLDKEHKPDDPIQKVFAFPRQDSKGTWDMVERAKKAGILVIVDTRCL